MKEIKRNMMNGYVEFTDGTFGKKLDPRYGMTEAANDGNWYVGVHEDEASAFEPALYCDDVDCDDIMEMNELEEEEILNDYYSLYWKNDLNGVPGQLIKSVQAEEEIVDILRRAEACNYDMFQELLMDFLTDLFKDIETSVELDRKWLFRRYMAILNKLREEFDIV